MDSFRLPQKWFLFGMVESTAARIVEYRDQIGQFTSVDQILDIRGIGQKKFEKMRPFLTL